ncbi:MAG: type II secretion system protein [Planctomycetota bacterium]|jgi:prepilin-type N-terminal cleavage/methylation domain-containing protein
MRRAFTIVELLAAMGLLGVLLAVSGVIFGTAVKAYRTAEATAEMSRKLAATPTLWGCKRISHLIVPLRYGLR